MDFAKLMSAQIAKKQQPLHSNSSTPTSPGQKYLKRSELEAEREAEYLAEQAAKERERIRKVEGKRKAEDDEARRYFEREAKREKLAEESKRLRHEEEQRDERERRKRIGLPELPLQEDASQTETTPPSVVDDIPDEELIAKLREIAEPARIFGESHAQRLRRFRRLEERRLQKDNSKEHLLAPMARKPILTSLEPVPEADMKVPAKVPPPSDGSGRLYLARQLTTWFNLVLRNWAIALAGRSEETKKTFTGQAAANSMVQALDHLRPLFRRLEKISSSPSDLPDDLFVPIVEIVHKAQERRYVEANDGYLKLSIGKAAWPIGVTMVGIHERSAREKLHESDKGKAHIMADEATRKILQSIKRCLTFAQTRWPPSDIGQLMG